CRVVVQHAHRGTHVLREQVTLVHQVQGERVLVHGAVGTVALRGPGDQAGDHPVDDGAHEVVRQRAGGQCISRCAHRTATVVPEDHHQRSVQQVHTELDRAGDRGVYHMPGSAHDEQVPQPAVEDDLGGHTRVR